MTPPTPRLWDRVDRSGDCWLWLGSQSRGGYGHLSIDGKMVMAHRYVYELLVGPIPNGMTLDHLCRVTACVRPAHLEPVTMTENILRGSSFSAVNAAKTVCAHGHPFSESSWVRREDGRLRRVCRACRAVVRARRRAGAA